MSEFAVSVSYLVTGSFHWHNPYARTMALRSIQPLKEMSSRNISWGGKGGWCIGLTLLPCADFLENWEPQIPGTIRAVIGLHRDCLLHAAALYLRR
jgi:hypothetical protein